VLKGHHMLIEHLLEHPCPPVLRQANLTLEASRQVRVTVGEFEADTEQATGRIDHTVHNCDACNVCAVDRRLQRYLSALPDSNVA
jgi:hypothetical protein